MAVSTNRQTEGRGCGCGTLGSCSQGRFSPAPPNGRLHRHSAPDVNLKPGDVAESRSFLTRDRIVGTYSFHWYDIHAGAHLADPDGADAPTAHPPGLEHFSCKSVRWHKRRLADMEAAGIDLALMAFRD